MDLDDPVCSLGLGLFSGEFIIIFPILRTFGPTFAAIIVISITEGRAGLHRLRQRVRQWRVSWQWYLLVLVGIEVLILLGVIIQPGMLASFQGLSPILLVSFSIYFFIIFFGGGPLGEEPGWRGFALPRMQPRYGPLWGTLLLGVLWGFWHLPDYVTPEYQGEGPGTGLAAIFINFPIFVLAVLALAVIFTWIFNHTQGSVFIVILAHTSVNVPQVVWISLFPAVDVTRLLLALLIGFGVPALLIIILTRGRLGYQPSKEQP